jgi:hypothetical protein
MIIKKCRNDEEIRDKDISYHLYYGTRGGLHLINDPLVSGRGG